MRVDIVAICLLVYLYVCRYVRMRVDIVAEPSWKMEVQGCFFEVTVYVLVT